MRWGERRAQSADEFQASFLHASKVTLGPSPVTCDLVFLSPLLPGEMGRKDPSDLRASELRRGGGVGTALAKSQLAQVGMGWGQSQPYGHMVIKSKANHLDLKLMPGLKCRSHIVPQFPHL